MARTKKDATEDTTPRQSKEELQKATEYFANHTLQEYAGKYVALVGEEIVASGKDPRDVYKRAVQKEEKIPLIARVSRPDEHIW